MLYVICNQCSHIYSNVRLVYDGLIVLLKMAVDEDDFGFFLNAVSTCNVSECFILEGVVLLKAN